MLSPRGRAPHTCGVAGVCAEGQHLDVLVVGAGGQQLAAVAPGGAVDGALVVFVPLEHHGRLLQRSLTEREETQRGVTLTLVRWESNHHTWGTKGKNTRK